MPQPASWLCFYAALLSPPILLAQGLVRSPRLQAGGHVVVDLRPGAVQEFPYQRILTAALQEPALPGPIKTTSICAQGWSADELAPANSRNDNIPDKLSEMRMHTTCTIRHTSSPLGLQAFGSKPPRRKTEEVVVLPPLPKHTVSEVWEKMKLSLSRLSPMLNVTQNVDSVISSADAKPLWRTSYTFERSGVAGETPAKDPSLIHQWSQAATEFRSLFSNCLAPCDGIIRAFRSSMESMTHVRDAAVLTINATNLGTDVGDQLSWTIPVDISQELALRIRKLFLYAGHPNAEPAD